MYTATIIPFDDDDSVTTKQFADFGKARQFAMLRTRQDWSTVRVSNSDSEAKQPAIETSHNCGQNDIFENGEFKGTF